jgi:hypothetical protein
MASSLQNIKQRLSALRNALDVLIGEVEAIEPAPAPRKRRNLKAGRVMQFSENGWSKPAELRKTARKGGK